MTEEMRRKVSVPVIIARFPGSVLVLFPGLTRSLTTGRSVGKKKASGDALFQPRTVGRAPRPGSALRSPWKMHRTTLDIDRLIPDYTEGRRFCLTMAHHRSEENTSELQSLRHL